jgi:hypothetical protein
MLEIPLIAVPNQQLLARLDEQDCTINVYQRGARVYLDLALDGVPLRQGAICLPGVPVVDAPWPFVGGLYMVDTGTTPKGQQPPQWEGLGTRWKLYYLDAAEMAEVAALRTEGVADG